MSLVTALLLVANPQLSGWVVFWNDRSLESFAKNARQIAEVMPEWIKVTADGQAVRRFKDDPKSIAFLQTAAKNHIAVYGMTSNFGDDDFDPKRMTVFLTDPIKRDRHIEQLAGIAAKDKLAGIDLDYESLAAGDRDPFSEFVERLAARLHRDKRKLSVTVHAKDSEPGNWDGAIAQDWARLGKAADIMRVMTYDQHWSTSEAGPIAADEWAKQVMRFAVSVVPARKLEMGVAAYGYDWSKKPAASLTWDDFAPKVGVEDPESGEIVIDQTRFSGASAFARKQEIAKSLGLRGLALWYFGSEQPTLWSKR
jgi:spore germination protein